VAAARRTRATILAAAVLLTTAVGAPSSTIAADPGGNGRIVFASAPGDTHDTSIWVMDADGTDRAPLTSPPTAADRTPRWSPDGTRIAFTRRPDGGAEDAIWVMDADGSDETELGEGVGPAWSRSGSRIAFVEITDPVFDRDVWVMDADGSDRTQVTDGDEAIAVDWAPDGGRIAYGNDALGGFDGDVRSVRPDGTDDRLVRATVAAPRPAHSPDGRRIAYAESVGGALEIVTVPAAGGQVTDVTSRHPGLPARLEDPVFSPDGRWIVFTGYPTPGRGDLYRLAADGSGSPLNLTSSPDTSETSAHWQPAPSYPFGDIATSPFVHDIVWLRAEGLTSGCTGFWFCPRAPVTRGELATFLARTLDLPPVATDYFRDDDASSHESSIDRIRAAGIATGCAPDRFCPDAAVTRAQLATMFARAFHLPASAEDHFGDDESSVHEADIDRLAAAGITSGCAPDRFCPTATVSREQVAAFLHRAAD